MIAAFDGVRSWLYRGNVGVGNGSGGSPELENALRALAEFDAEAASVFEKADPKEIARYHYDRVIRLGEVIKAAPPEDRLEYEKQRINSLAAAYQTGEYPAGKDLLNRLIKAGGPLASYAAYSLIPAEYMLRAADDPDKVIEAERAWIADLERFLEDYPNADEVPDALIQLARVKEFNGDEAAARDAFDRLARDFAGTPAGLKGAGALKRLDLDGKTLELSGTGPDGATVDAASIRGKHLLVVFGAFRKRRHAARASRADRPARPSRGFDRHPRRQPRRRPGGRPRLRLADLLAVDRRRGGHRRPPRQRVRHHLPADDDPGRAPTARSSTTTSAPSPRSRGHLDQAVAKKDE